MKRRISSAVMLFALSSLSFAHSTHPADMMSNGGKFYIGAFGGGGSSDDFKSDQFGTAFYTEAAGGPLAVNGFGLLNGQSSSYFGLQLGYQARAMMVSTSQLSLAPAAELEGYGLGNSTFHGDLINNTARLPEHDFQISYPMSRTVFLGNAVINFNHPRLWVHPYVGLGIGQAIIRISGANALQVSPPEPGINHYNSNNNSSDSVFAGQIKIGLSYDINPYFTVFADYRWLYLANSFFVFGSTVYAPHVPTSSWQVKLDSQRYNLGNIGVRVNI